MYRVIEGFYDLQDEHDGYFHEYKAGDAYPREGYEATQERIEELSGSDNKRGSALIAEAEDPAEKKSRRK